ncbi:hypothetical protein ACTWP5_24790 [Streptomyces sp. 4N509B]|uniref:hypothetical protein n=1 Tax=Streptomyces sp. 4N509B TaxID=3457413 RepID=UPI003FD56E27
MPVLALALLLSGVPAARGADGEGGAGEGGAGGVDALVAELGEADREATDAREAYEEAATRLREQRDRVTEISDELAGTRGELASARELAGRLAREQYRRGGAAALPAGLRVLLGEDPDRALHAGTVARRAAEAHLTTVRRLVEGEESAAELARREREELDARQARARELRRERDAAERRLEDAVDLLVAAAAPAAVPPDASEEPAAPEGPGGSDASGASSGRDGAPDDGEPDDGEPDDGAPGGAHRAAPAAPRNSARSRGVSRWPARPTNSAMW